MAVVNLFVYMWEQLCFLGEELFDFIVYPIPVLNMPLGVVVLGAGLVVVIIASIVAKIIDIIL